MAETGLIVETGVAVLLFAAVFLAARAQPSLIALERSAIEDVEYTALIMLTEAEQALGERGVTVWLTAINPDLLMFIERSGWGAGLRRERIFFNLLQAPSAWQLRSV